MIEDFPVALRILHSQLISSALVLGLLSTQAQWAFGGSDFGANWQAKPLVDTSVTRQPVAESKPTPTKPVTPAQPELEARLKPAEPFIKDVEARLTISPTTGSPLVQRLNNLQSILFGEQKYQDAGELLAKLAEMFPQEAAKANAELNKQLQSSLPPVKPTPSTSADKANKTHSKAAKPIIQPPAYGADSGAYPTTALQTAPTKAKKRKKSIWQDDWDNSFENDPFFRDEPQQRAQASQGPSKLAAVGQGLTSLALIAGSLAGTYYLNKQNGNNYYPNNGYYNNGYYASPYGVPYGSYPYGAYPSYGAYGAYGAPMAGAYPGYYGAAPQLNYIPRTFTPTPYTPSYYDSRFGATSTPLGVPTGIPRY